jgi:hypothetical protein
MARQDTAFVPVNQALLNVITPMGLEIRKNSLVIGENTGKIYGVIKYPQKVDIGWLSKVTNILARSYPFPSALWTTAR